MNLFSPDNFTESSIGYRPAAVLLGDVESILKIYGIEGKIVDISQRDRKEINSENFRITLHMRDGSEKKFLLRRYRSLANVEQIRFWLSLVHTLATHEVPVSDALETLKKEHCVAFRDGWVYALFPFIEGHHFVSSINVYRSVAKTIATMHVVFRSFDQPVVAEIKRLSQESKAYFTIIPSYTKEDFTTIASIMEAKTSPSESEREFLSALPLCLKKIDIVRGAQDALDQLPKHVIHSDLHPHNILIYEGQVAALLDFDGLRVSEQARDAAMALYRFGRQFFVPLHSEEAQTHAPMLTQEFVRAYVSIRPMSLEERDLMPILLFDEFLKKLLFVLRGIYYEGNETWAGDLPKFLVAFKEIDFFWPKIL